MPVARTRAVALAGLRGALVDIEADLISTVPGIVIIGLPDAALAEARERVRSAAANSGCPLPPRRITINLSPAALHKHGSGFDLAIALAALATAGVVPAESVARWAHIGELGLDGRVRAVPGVLPAVLAARRAGVASVMVPEACVREARLVEGIEVVGVATLRDAALRHGAELEDAPAAATAAAAPRPPAPAASGPAPRRCPATASPRDAPPPRPVPARRDAPHPPSWSRGCPRVPRSAPPP